MTDESIEAFILFLWATFPLLVIGLLLWPTPDAPQPEPERGLHVVSTLIYNDSGVVVDMPGEGNIMGNDGPYRKFSVWSDGQTVLESKSEWTDCTVGPAARNMK